jgi:hypothetical protein
VGLLGIRAAQWLRTTDRYSRIFDIILKQKGASLTIGIASLSWITWGRRPLTVTEFLDAIYLEVRENTKLSRSELNEDLVQRCSGYMVVPDNEAGLFRAAHLTVVEYMEGQQTDREFSFHHNAALSSLRAMIELSNPRIDRGIRDGGLKLYATVYWSTHLQRSVPEGNPDVTTIKVLSTFLGEANKPGRPYLYWYKEAIEWHKTSGDITYGPVPLTDQLCHVLSDPISPLFAAANWGHYVPSLWESDFDPNLRNARHEPLIYVAATCYHKRTVKDPIRCGHFEILRRLLEMGADANAEGGYNGYALAQAVESADIRLVEVLLKHGARVDVSASEWSSMLQLAVFHGSGDVAQFLIDNGRFSWNCGTHSLIT